MGGLIYLEMIKQQKIVKQFFKKNWDKTIKVHSTDTPNDWEVWFELDGKEYVASFISCFGDIEE